MYGSALFLKSAIACVKPHTNESNAVIELSPENSAKNG
jgi:hypothetical protein